MGLLIAVSLMAVSICLVSTFDCLVDCWLVHLVTIRVDSLS